MRRWLIVLIALVIAAQFSWAVEATTTGMGELHSAGADVALATSPSSATDGSDVAQAQGNDTAHICDASHCHCFHGYTATGSPVPYVLGAEPPGAPREAPAGMGESHIPPRIERPNWRCA
jgi:hypothetical protein